MQKTEDGLSISIISSILGESETDDNRDEKRKPLFVAATIEKNYEKQLKCWTDLNELIIKLKKKEELLELYVELTHSNPVNTWSYAAQIMPSLA